MTSIADTDLSKVRTVWAFGVPLAARVPLQAALPDQRFLFPPIARPLIDRANEVMASDAPALASWGGTRVVDHDAFLNAHPLPLVTIAEGGFQLQADGGSSSTITLGFSVKPEARTSGAVLAEPNTRQIAEAASLLQKIVKNNIGRFNYAAPEAPTGLLLKNAVLVVGDGPDASARGRFDAYINLVSRARTAYPNAKIVFIPDGDYEIPNNAVANIIEIATTVLHIPYHPSMAAAATAIFVHQSTAGLDGVARQKPVVCNGGGAMEALAKAPTSLGLAKVIASLYLADIYYADPDANVSISASQVVDLIEQKVRILSPAVYKPGIQWRLKKGARADVVPVDGSILTNLSDAATVPLKPTKAVGEKTPKITQVKALAVPTAATTPVKKANAAKPKSRSRMGSVPDWLLPEPSDLVPNSVVRLDQDFRDTWPNVAEAAAVANSLKFEPYAVADGVTRFSRLVVEETELSMRLVEGRVRRSGAAHALIGDLSDPATRLFSRVCQSVGMHRIFVPQNLFGTSDDWHFAAAPAKHAILLADTAIVWDQSQTEFLIEAGFPSDRIRFAKVQTRPFQVVRENLIVVHVNAAWRVSDDAEFYKFVGELSSYLTAFSYRIVFYLDLYLFNVLTDAALASLSSMPHIEFEMLGAEIRSLDELLKTAALLISWDRAMATRAWRAGVTALIVDRSLEQERQSHWYGSDTVWLKTALSNWLDERFEPPAPRDYPSAPSLAIALQKVTDNDEVPNLKMPGELVLSSPAVALARVSSGVTRAEKNEQLPFLEAFLNADEWMPIAAEAGLAGLLNTDLLVEWGPPDLPSQQLSGLGRRLGLPCLRLEDGFVRSVHASAITEPSLSIVIDDLGPYHDARTPNRLNLRLQSNESISVEDREAALAGIARLKETKVSAYNAAPYLSPRKLSHRKTLLVIDQRVGSPKIPGGLAGQADFRDMVDEALRLADQYEIIVKAHPRSASGLAADESAIGEATMAFLKQRHGVTVITDDVNPWSLIEAADQVFVVSSSLGFEALMAEKPVRCFGRPFYAGLGLTQDPVSPEAHSRNRPLEEVFHFAYLQASRYYHPEREERCSFFELIDYVVASRPWGMPLSDFGYDPLAWDPTHELGRLSQPDRATLKSRDRGLEAGKEETVFQIVKAAEYSSFWVYNFADWKRDYLRTLFGEAAMSFVPLSTPFANTVPAISNSERPAFVVWGRKQPPGVLAFSRARNVPVFFMEDGFIRSVGLGANRVLPYSFCLDSRGIYFDATRPSDLEVILSDYDFDRDPALIAEAHECLERIIETGISKYNFSIPPIAGDPFGPKLRKRIIVVGQVEDDASIIYGGPKGITNNDLVRLARTENEDAQIIYKIHPDVLAGKRTYYSDPAEVAHLCEISSEVLSLSDALAGVDHVYTITSLLGFEALIRGIKVTTVGAPFYSGWGLTDERMPIARRNRRLTMIQVFAASYLLYAKYADPLTGEKITLRETIEILVNQRDRQLPEMDFSFVE